MGAGLLKNYIVARGIKNVEVASAGVSGNPEYKIYGYLAELMDAKGIDRAGHVSTKIAPKHMVDFDVIIVMERQHKKYLCHKYPWAKSKIFLLKELAGEGEVDIPDPMGRPDEAYRMVFDEISACVDKIAETLTGK